MNSKEAVKTLVGETYVLTKTIELEDIDILYYQDERSLANYSDDRYPIPVGNGPIVYDKKTNQYHLTGVQEFLMLYSPLFPNVNIDSPIDLEHVIDQIIKRKHINWNDWGLFMEYHEIPEDDTIIQTLDNANRIETEEGIVWKEDIVITTKASHSALFIKFLEKIQFPYTKKNPTTILTTNTIF